MKKIFISFIALVQIACLGSRAEDNKNFDVGGMSVCIDANTGALLRMTDVSNGWEVIDSGRAGAFEMTLTAPDGTKRTLTGQDQKAPKVQTFADSVVFEWSNLKLDGRKTGIGFVGTVKFSPQFGLIFAGKVENKGKYVLDKLSWPYIGGMNVPDRDRSLRFQKMYYNNLNSDEIFPNPAFERIEATLPKHSFVMVADGQNGFVGFCMDKDGKECINFVVSSTQTAESMARVGSVEAKTADGLKSPGLLYKAAAERNIFVQPGKSRELMPFALKTFDGTWHAGADIYLAWKKTWYKFPHFPDWMLGIHSWQQIQTLSSTSRINYKISDLLDLARECSENGVKALQVTGWNWGGQDRAIPTHTVDPRLGTAEEFRNVIKAADEKYGVKIVPFTKFTWSEVSSPFHEMYKDYLVELEDGRRAVRKGYNYFTYVQLASMDTRRLGILCMSDPRCRKLLCDEFKKVLIDLDAPGMNYDEAFNFVNANLCFCAEHQHDTPGFNYCGMLQLGREFHDLIMQHNPEFFSICEACWDLQTQYYGSYTRQRPEHVAAFRYLNPYLPVVSMISDHMDFNRVNMNLRCRYLTSYEPGYFKGRLSEIPQLMEYGRKVDALRERYSSYLWDAEFRDVLGASVRGRDLQYSLFLRPDGKRAVVIANTNVASSRTATLILDTPATGELVVVSPDSPDEKPFDGSASIGPQGVIVVMEK